MKVAGLTLSALAVLLAALAVAAPSAWGAGEDADQTMEDAAAATVPETGEVPPKIVAIDFGTTTTLPPFKANVGGDGVIFSGDVAFGGSDYPDPVIGDWVAAKALTVVDLGKGVYRGAIIAQSPATSGDTNSGMVSVKSFSIKANGSGVVSVEVRPKDFFSRDALYYGMQFEDLPGTDWWARYIEPVAPWRMFEFGSNGALNLELDGCRVCALVLAKADDVSEEEFQKFLADVQAARKSFFLSEKFKLETQPTGEMEHAAGDMDRGYVVFSRYWGEMPTHYSVPADVERVTKLAVSGALGERVPLTVSIRSFKPLAKVNVVVSDLQADGGRTIPASAVSVMGVRYKLLKGRSGTFTIEPDVLQPQPDLSIPANLTKTWWLTVAIPGDAGPGLYAGSVTVKPADAPATELPLSVEVYPFSLGKPQASIGLWYSDPSDLGYNTGLMGGASLKDNSHWDASTKPDVTDIDREVEAFRVAMLEADMKSLAEHGFNGITVGTPRIKEVRPDGTTRLGFAMSEAYPPLLKKYGINTDFPGQVFLLTLAMQMTDFRINSRRIEEYSDFHATVWKDAAGQTRDFWREAGVKVLAYVVDEPREQEINEWNRNLVGTLYYLRLVGEMGGWLSTVTTMADRENGIDYMPILEKEDIVQPHPGERDVRSVAYARKEEKPVRYFNGSGFKRYPFGFYLWSQRPEGYWQWHFNFWNFAWNPVWEAHVGYTTYPSPDGPLATPGYERAAAGICDYRYALTLEDYIAKARASARPEAMKAADEAVAYLDEIRSGCTEWVLDKDWKPLGVPDVKLIEWRAGIVKRILAIEAAM